MVPGFNTDFKYRGETYHVQTEDNGLGNPVVVSLLYHKGAILASRRTPYHDIAGTPGYEKELAALMKTQHKDLMRALLSGAFDKDGAAPAVLGASGEHPADAAAAVAGHAPQASPQPAARRVTEPPPEPAPAAPRLRPAAAAPASRSPAPAPHPAPRPSALTLDESIWRYLETFAAQGATAN